MHDVLLMHEVECQEHLPDYLCCLLLTEAFALIRERKYFVEQVTTGYKLSDDIEVAIILHEVEYTCDMGMLCLL